MNPESQSKHPLEDIFHAFTGGAKDMDSRQYIKFARDCSLLDKKLEIPDIEFIFFKVKVKRARTITFVQFKQALEQMATKKGVGKEVVLKQIEKTGGPHFHGTIAESVRLHEEKSVRLHEDKSVRLHDDKSTYTGVYIQGGSTTVDQQPSSLSTLKCSKNSIFQKWLFCMSC